MCREGDEMTQTGQGARYQIKIAGRLASCWARRFEGLSMEQDEGGDTLLSGTVIDQAALHGLLRIVRDSGMTLLSVVRLETGEADAPDNN
ncbi:MAG: hypothetical protein ACK2UR_12085 [Candidatus Promineifilaceae bacterium]